MQEDWSDEDVKPVSLQFDSCGSELEASRRVTVERTTTRLGDAEDELATAVDDDDDDDDYRVITAEPLHNRAAELTNASSDREAPVHISEDDSGHTGRDFREDSISTGGMDTLLDRGALLQLVSAAENGSSVARGMFGVNEIYVSL